MLTVRLRRCATNNRNIETVSHREQQVAIKSMGPFEKRSHKHLVTYVIRTIEWVDQHTKNTQRERQTATPKRTENKRWMKRQVNCNNMSRIMFIQFERWNYCMLGKSSVSTILRNAAISIKTCTFNESIIFIIDVLIFALSRSLFHFQ